MGPTPWILVTILILIIVLAVVAFWVSKNNKKKRATDYYNLFVIGIVWVAIGIPLKMLPLSVVGLVLMITALANKSKWKANRVKWSDLTEKERKVKMFVIIGLLILLVLGAAAYFFAAK